MLPLVETTCHSTYWAGGMFAEVRMDKVWKLSTLVGARGVGLDGLSSARSRGGVRVVATADGKQSLVQRLSR